MQLHVHVMSSLVQRWWDRILGSWQFFDQLYKLLLEILSFEALPYAICVEDHLLNFKNLKFLPTIKINSLSRNRQKARRTIVWDPFRDCQGLRLSLCKLKLKYWRNLNRSTDGDLMRWIQEGYIGSQSIVADSPRVGSQSLHILELFTILSQILNNIFARKIIITCRSWFNGRYGW